MATVNMELKYLRVKNGLTQEETAKILNMTTATYSRKENGIREFSINEAKKISDLFNTSIEEIFFNN